MNKKFNANKKVEELLDDDEKVNIYNAGMRKGMEHSIPSPETRERLIKIETIMEQNTKEHTEIKEAIIDIKKDIKEAMANLDKKYASKPTEFIVYGMVGIILAYVVGKWLNLI